MSAAKSRGFLVESYASRFGEPRFKQEAHGYWLFVAGVLLGLLGLFVLAYSAMAEPRSAAAFNRRQIAGILGGIGLPLLMLGVVYRLPVNRKVDAVAIIGTLICLASVVAFVFYYPGRWNVVTGGADFAVPITGVYGIGLLVISVAALVLPHTTETHEAVMEEEVAEEPDEEPAKSKARFQIYKDRKGEWRWNLRHNNGNLIADCAEGYSSKQKAKQGLESVRKNTPGAPIEERKNPPESETDGGFETDISEGEDTEAE